jgi:hypothetical protein
MTSVEKVAQGIAAGWRQLASESALMHRAVAAAVADAERAEQAEYREAARIYRRAECAQ